MLLVGNIMNKGTQRGGASGFTLDSLRKVINTKGAAYVLWNDAFFLLLLVVVLLLVLLLLLLLLRFCAFSHPLRFIYVVVKVRSQSICVLAIFIFRSGQEDVCVGLRRQVSVR